VLEEISQTSIPMPGSGKWANAGMASWGNGSLAWRVLDAQYWGVPQRRKRIFLVADFSKQSAGEILFEPESLHGHIAESEGEGQEPATDAGTGTESTGGQDPDSNHGGLAIFDMTHATNPVQSYNNKLCHTLTSRMGTGGNQVPVVCLNDQGGSVMDVSDKAATLRAQSHGHEPIVHTIGGEKKTKGHCYSMGHDQRASTYPCEKADSLMASDYKQPPIANDTAKTVRKLTPTECERLQGLPDGYTNIEFNGKPAPDSRRYKALGNGMAQPCARFVIRRIAEVVNDNE
jgi:DNA (cytosine-5)-methyltransferase 1